MENILDRSNSVKNKKYCTYNGKEFNLTKDMSGQYLIITKNINFKVCKSYLNLSKEFKSMSYDAMTAHTAIVFTRYMMLSLESRESNDTRSMGELFLYFSDEMSDITWIQAFQMLLQMFRTLLADHIDISNEKIDELVDAFMDAIPILLKSKLQAA